MKCTQNETGNTRSAYKYPSPGFGDAVKRGEISNYAKNPAGFSTLKHGDMYLLLLAGEIAVAKDGKAAGMSQAAFDYNYTIA